MLVEDFHEAFHVCLFVNSGKFSEETGSLRKSDLVCLLDSGSDSEGKHLLLEPEVCRGSEP